MFTRIPWFDPQPILTQDEFVWGINGPVLRSFSWLQFLQSTSFFGAFSDILVFSQKPKETTSWHFLKAKRTSQDHFEALNPTADSLRYYPRNDPPAHSRALPASAGRLSHRHKAKRFRRSVRSGLVDPSTIFLACHSFSQDIPQKYGHNHIIVRGWSKTGSISFINIVWMDLTYCPIWSSSLSLKRSWALLALRKMGEKLVWELSLEDSDSIYPHWPIWPHLSQDLYFSIK